MSTQNTDELTLEELKRVAELDGWQYVPAEGEDELDWMARAEDFDVQIDATDYPIDDNLLRRLREKLLVNRNLRTNYYCELVSIVFPNLRQASMVPITQLNLEPYYLVHASPVQQCRALLKVFEEEENV